MIPSSRACEVLGITRHQLQVVFPLLGIKPRQDIFEGRKRNLFTLGQVDQMRTMLPGLPQKEG